MESNKTTIGERIKQQRQKLGLTQQELSQKLYVKRETINQWENGTRQIKGDDIARLADTLETTCDYILRGIETEQLHFFKDLGLTGNAVRCLQKMAPGIGGNDVLNSLIGNRLFALFVRRWGDYCASVEICNIAKRELVKSLSDSGTTLSTKQPSDDECTIIAYDQRKAPTASEACKNAANLFMERQDKKEYYKFKLQQAVNALTEDFDKSLHNDGR